MAYGSQSGRSMVEILGVLAIIGVLSVGAISGYQKAMMKYKLNKYAESINLLVNNFIQFRQSLGYTKGGWTDYNEILHKLNLIPDGIRYNGDITDIFGNKLRAYHDNRSDTTFNHDGIIFQFDNSDTSSEACKTLVETAFENRGQIWQLYLQPQTGGGSYYSMFGDKWCSTSVRCLRDLNLDDIHNICNTYRHKDSSKYSFRLQITFK